MRQAVFRLRAGLLALMPAVALFAGAAAAQAPSEPIPLPGGFGQESAQFQLPQQGNTSVDPSSAAGLSLRISQLEEQIRQLNGQVEQLSHTVRMLQGQLGQTPPAAGMPSRSSATMSSSTAPSGSGDAEFLGSGTGQPPQILGQVPGQGVDLSGALNEPIAEFGTAPGGGRTQVAAAPTGDPRQDYDTAYGHILRGEFDVAEASFRQFLGNYPDSELAGNAQYWLGESLYARGRYRDAADAFLAGYTDHPDNAKAPDSLFKLGMSLKELGERDAACASLTEIARKYPSAPQAVRERAQSEMDKSGC